MTFVILGAIVLAGLYGVFLYNTLVALRQRARQAFADIDVQLLQRRDLAPGPVENRQGLRHP